MTVCTKPDECYLVCDLENRIEDLEADNSDLEDQAQDLEKKVKVFEDLIPGSKSGDLFVDFKKYQEKVEELTDMLDRQGCTEEVRRIVDDLQFAQRRQHNRTYCEALRTYMEDKKDRTSV